MCLLCDCVEVLSVIAPNVSINDRFLSFLVILGGGVALIGPVILLTYQQNDFAD